LFIIPATTGDDGLHRKRGLNSLAKVLHRIHDLTHDLLMAQSSRQNGPDHPEEFGEVQRLGNEPDLLVDDPLLGDDVSGVAAHEDDLGLRA